MTLRVSLTDTQRELTLPTQNAHRSWSERAGCIVTLQSDSGAQGSGEASPLPGFSPDRLEECVAALRVLDVTDVPQALQPGHSALGELARISARLPARLPAARAAFEAALLDLWARSAGRPAWALLTDAHAPPAPRRLAALLTGEPEQALAQAEQAFARGLRCFKFKIGRLNAAERELSAVAALRQTLGPEARLRLDANQSLSVSAARAYLPRFAAQRLEYIEEPCAPGELAQLADLGLPIAWDESLLSGQLPPSETPLRALVLKPTLLGGVTACASWAERAARIGAHVILSHAFEGPLGLALSATLALCFGSAELAHGLDVAGARLLPAAVPFLSGPELRPWSEPGFGLARGSG